VSFPRRLSCTLHYSLVKVPLHFGLWNADFGLEFGMQAFHVSALLADLCPPTNGWTQIRQQDGLAYHQAA